MQNNNHTYSKADPKTKIDFTPTNDQEKDHLKRLYELLGAKRKGDWVLVGEMCGISAKNAEVSFSRVYSKYHNQVVDALDNIIDARVQLLTKK